MNKLLNHVPVFVKLSMKYKLFSISTIIVSLCNTVFAQQSDSLPKKSLLDKSMSLFEWKIRSSTISTFPSAGYDPSSGLYGGILQVVSIPPKDTLKFSRSTSLVNLLTYSTKNWINLKSDLILYTRSGFNINAYVQFLQAPDSFYGIGNDTLNPSPVQFNIKDFELRGDISKSIANTFFSGIVFDLSHTYTQAGDSTLLGLQIPAQKNMLIIGVGPHFAFDRRNDVNYPSKGEIITASFLYYPIHAENSYTFFTFQFEAKKYMTVYKDLILASQFFTGSATGDVPFYNLYQLGGKSRMRGVSNKYKYIDSHVYYAQAEFRKHVWGRFSAVAFGALGNTCESYSDIDLGHLKYVYGGGIRFQTSKTEKLHLRIDYGRGIFGDSGVYVTMREGF